MQAAWPIATICPSRVLQNNGEIRSGVGLLALWWPFASCHLPAHQDRASITDFAARRSAHITSRSRQVLEGQQTSAPPCLGAHSRSLFDRGCVKRPKGRSRRGFLFLWSPPAWGGLGSRRFAAAVWGKSVLTVAGAAEFLHGQDPEQTSTLRAYCNAASSH